MRTLRSSSLPTVINMRRNFRITRRCECLPLVETPEIGSVKLFSRGWTLIELSELVREGRNLAYCARTSMGLTYDRDPTMMYVFSTYLLGERVRRRIEGNLPMWRPAPANPPTPTCDLNTHVGTSLERRAPRQRTLRVRSDRVISVSDPVWVSMEIGRNDRDLGLLLHCQTMSW